MNVTIYTDGSARGNPDGPGGYGTVIEYVDTKGVLHTREFSGGYKKTTNNRMELMGVIVGLKALTKSCNVKVVSDSKYVTNAFNEHWIEKWELENWRRGKKNEVKNIDLWLQLLEAKKTHKVTFTWVKGHAGHPQNERCDKLATSAADSDNLLTDAGVDDTMS